MKGGSIVGVAHTGITTSDLDRSIRFFRDVLRLPVSDRQRLQGPVFAGITGVPEAEIEIAYVDAPGHRLELLQYLKPEARRASALRPCDSGHLHLSFQVDDIEDVLGRMHANGFASGPVQTVQEAGGLKAIYAHGPDALVIELMQFPAQPSPEKSP